MDCFDLIEHLGGGLGAAVFVGMAFVLWTLMVMAQLAQPRQRTPAARLVTSNAFEGQPAAWVGNQCGHAVIGVVAVTYAGLLNEWWYVQPAAAALITLFYFAISEWALQGLRLFWDSMVDTFHVGVGALLVLAIQTSPAQASILLTVWGATLGAGAWARR